MVLGPVNGANNCKYTNHIMTQLQKEGYRVVFKHYKNFKLKHNENNEIEPQPVASTNSRNTLLLTLLQSTILTR